MTDALRKTIMSIILGLALLPLHAQQKDSIIVDFPDEYLDTVKIKVQDKINDYSMIGASYGVTFSRQYFNPSYQQDFVFRPTYFSVMFTHYEKMFDYLPYFGFQIGASYSHEGYKFRTDKDTGNPSLTVNGASTVTVDTVEMPFMMQAHVDARSLRFLANLGIYGGYRLKIHREGPAVPEELVNNFCEQDNRLDYGALGGIGVGFVFEPFEFHVSALVRYSFSTMFQPNYASEYYYIFANPLDVIVHAGVHIHISNRTGKTNRQLRQQAREIVYPSGR